MTSAGLTFLSWVRTGLISTTGGTGNATGSPLDASRSLAGSLPVTLGFDDGQTATFEANLIGPGDVIGLDPHQVIRCDPAPGASTEPNYFAIVEFDRPDLPWMLTSGAPALALPTDADARRGLRPWLCLVVVPDTPLTPPTSRQPLPCLSVLDRELPDLATAWLWAHAQVLTTAGGDLDDVLAHQPDRTLSRLIAPRRLQPGTSYLACVVPTFEAGRRAGLGLDAPTSGSLAPAWTRGDAPRTVALPVYHSWRFSTAKVRGDFEELARRLHPAQFGDSGVRDLDLGRAGSGLPQPPPGATSKLALEGVLVGDRVVPGAWSGWSATARQAFQQALAARLASSASELAPPTYGALQAGFSGSLAAVDAPRWLRELNLDPRYRATAALGTRIVQRHQEALMASAWEQTAAIREANRLLRQAQLARAVGEVIERRIQASALGTDRLLQLTAPIHAQVATATGATVAAALAHSAAVTSSVSHAFRRAARPKGPLARRLTDEALSAPVVRLGLPAASAQAVRPTPQLRAVPGTVDLGAISGATESLATVTSTRVLKPVFPWEAAVPPAVPPNIPFGFMSDLVVEAGGTPSQPSPVAIGSALDFDGAAQRGWQLAGNGATSIPTNKTSTYIDRIGLQGIVSVGYEWIGGGGVDSMYWTPGYLFEPSGGAIRGEPAPRPKAIAAADLLGTGRVDVVFVLESQRQVQAGASPGSVWFKTLYSTYLEVRLDFDPATATFRGDRTGALMLAQDQPSPMSLTSFTASGSSIFFLDNTTLRVMRLDYWPSGMFHGPVLIVASDASTDLAPHIPHGAGGTAIATADFGGSTGTDLLVFYVDGSRAGYRIAYDVSADGSVGSWGEMFSPPISVGERFVGVALGVTSRAADLLRTERTTAFRQAAAATQDRQARVLALAGPPPPAPAVDATQLAGEVGAAIDPNITVEATVAARLELAAPIDPASLTDPLQPLALTPRFQYPTFELFRDAFPDRVYPGASRIPDDTVAALVVDRAALESFLVGLNHEMSRELLWRGFPLRHGTYFAQFWQAGRDEIAAIERWAPTSPLGAHPAPGVTAPSLLLVIRGELLRRIPDVTIYAAPSIPGPHGKGRAPDLARPHLPLFGGLLHSDIRFLAFDLAGPTDGWYFVFQQHPTAPRFGLDEASAGWGTPPSTWADLQWPQVVASEAEFKDLVYIDAGPSSPLADMVAPDGGSSPLHHRWGFSAAHQAHITLQLPALIAIHASRLLGSAPR